MRSKSTVRLPILVAARAICLLILSVGIVACVSPNNSIGDSTLDLNSTGIDAFVGPNPNINGDLDFGPGNNDSSTSSDDGCSRCRKW